MRKRRDPENDQHRRDRLEKNAQNRRDDVAAEDKALDAAVRRSIMRFGA